MGIRFSGTGIRRARAMMAFALGLAAGPASGQSGPNTLVLQGKVRDFVEDNPSVAPSHPHFFGNRAFPTCNAQQLGVEIAAPDIDTSDDAGDTSVFKGDNRGPRLLSPLDARAAACFDPVSRFSDWYNDRTSGDVNRAFLIDMPFVRDTATGLYEYIDDAFFPLDKGKAYRKLGTKDPFGALLPAPNDAHDFGFTLELHARFTYFKGKNQVFNFRGDDDVWVFVNGKKAIELGGIHASQDASFNLDSIAAAHGLRDSLVYPLDFFFAERHTTTSVLRITTSLELQPVTSPPLLTPGRYFDGSMTVTLSHPAPDAVLYYTTDGTVPTTASPKYEGPIAVSATTTLTAIALRPGYRPSEPVRETYTRMRTVATPEASPKGRSFVDPLQVALTDSTPGAVIRYTVDGSDPDSASPAYSGPIAIPATATLKARAYLPDWVPSAVMTEVYTDAATLPVPVADPGQKGFVTSITVALSVPGHPGASIHYTLDGTEPTEAGPLYAGTLVFDSTTTLKARAFQADLHPSPVLVQAYERLAAPVRAVYVDLDGDGRIDGAVIPLDIAIASAPASILLTDPFSGARKSVPSGGIALSADGRTLTARFPDQPFAAGTAFATDFLGSFAGAPGFVPLPFAVSDSAGPVPIKAVSLNKASPEGQAALDVTFSEPIDLAALQAGTGWPFAIIRGGIFEASPVEVVRIEAMAGQANTYRFTFAASSPAYPVYTDSLELARSPLVRDAGGAAGVPGGKRIAVQGGPVNVANVFEVELTNPIVRQPSDGTAVPAEVRANPFAVIGLTAAKEPICLSCPAGAEGAFLGGPTPPEWIIRSKYPFHFAFVVYDNLGNYVARTSGEVTAEMMARLPQDRNGFRALRFRWKPIASDGRAVGTGAYILKGWVRNKAGEMLRGIQGEGQVAMAAERDVLATFGYLRQAR